MFRNQLQLMYIQRIAYLDFKWKLNEPTPETNSSNKAAGQYSVKNCIQSPHNSGEIALAPG